MDIFTHIYIIAALLTMLFMIFAVKSGDEHGLPETERLRSIRGLAIFQAAFMSAIWPATWAAIIFLSYRNR